MCGRGRNTGGLEWLSLTSHMWPIHHQLLIPVQHDVLCQKLETIQNVNCSLIRFKVTQLFSILSPCFPLLQHVVFFVLRAIDWIVPDVPESLELKMKRERYLAKQALAENQEALLVSRGQWATSGSPGTSSPGQ